MVSFLCYLMFEMQVKIFLYPGKLYSNDGSRDFVDERHRHRYEVNPNFTHLFEEKGFNFVGHDDEGMRMEIVELKGDNDSSLF